MALAVGDIVQINDIQAYLGQQLMNVYYYRMLTVSADTDLNDVADQFITQVMQVVKTAQQTTLEHTRTITLNLTNGIDIHEQPISVNGTSVGDPAPSFEQLSFRLVRTTRDTRHGSKRIGGLADQASNGNNVASGLAVITANIATAMAADLVLTGVTGHNFTAEPVIVGRNPQGSPNAGELNLNVINPVQSASLIRLSTQATRRAGRGA